MDIERFAPHAGTTVPTVPPTLPATIELTGFSGRRHYLEQLATFTPRHRPQGNEGPWLPPLDSQL